MKKTLLLLGLTLLLSSVSAFPKTAIPLCPPGVKCGANIR